MRFLDSRGWVGCRRVLDAVEEWAPRRSWGSCEADEQVRRFREVLDLHLVPRDQAFLRLVLLADVLLLTPRYGFLLTADECREAFARVISVAEDLGAPRVLLESLLNYKNTLIGDARNIRKER